MEENKISFGSASLLDLGSGMLAAPRFLSDELQIFYKEFDELEFWKNLDLYQSKKERSR